jgi:hypothetical protein
MKSPAGLAGCLVFAAIIMIFLSGFGSRWAFGRLGLPEPIIDARGRYPDGSMVDPVNQALVASGYHQEASWALVLLVVSVFARLAILIRQRNRVWREYQEVQQRARRKP